VLGTPLSLTCAVHSDPDQYRFSCRRVGSISQQGAMPVNAAWPEEPPSAFDAWSVDGVSANERVGAEAFERPPRRRCEDNIRRANRTTKTTRAIVEP
jgi:hypothetical protein